MAVLIADGGGYKRIEVESEARPAVRWLAAGRVNFVLPYLIYSYAAPTMGDVKAPLTS